MDTESAESLTGIAEAPIKRACRKDAKIKEVTIMLCDAGFLFGYLGLMSISPV
jgi:hypothetical protein